MKSALSILTQQFRAFLCWAIWDRSVRGKLTAALFLVAIVPLSIFALLENQRQQDDLEDDGLRVLSASARYNAALLDAFVERGTVKVGSIATLSDWGDYLSLSEDKRALTLARVRNDLKSLTFKDRVFIYSVALLDSDGVNLADTQEIYEGRDESGTIYFRKPLLTGEATVSLIENIGLFFSAPVYVNEVPVGVLRVSYSDKILNHLLVGGINMAGKDSFPVLLRESGELLASSLSDSSWKTGEIPFRPNANPKEAGSLYSKSARVIDFAGKDWAMAVSELEANRWFVAYLQPWEHLMRPITDQRRNFLMTLLGIAVVLLVLGYGIAFLMVSPLHRIQSATAAVSRGVFDCEIIISSKDEFGQVAQAFNDMSNRLAIREAEIREAITQAQAANRAKSQFLAVMSHEIRTPLNSINGFSYLLKEDGGLNPSQLEYVERVVRAGDHLLHLINDILDYSRIEAGKVKLFLGSVSLERVIKKSVDFVADEASLKGVEILIEISPQVPAMIQSDEKCLTQILTNLMSNASKFTEEGYVHLQVSTTGSGNEGDLLVFTVEDSGVGVPPDYREKLFEPFSQADGSMTRSHGGTGLGLAITQRISEALGGKTVFVPETVSGAKFEAEVPIHKPSEELLAQVNGRSRRDGSRICLISNSEKSCEVLSRILGAEGYNVQCIDFLSRFTTEGAQLVILDLPSHDPDFIVESWIRQNDGTLEGKKLIVIHSSPHGVADRSLLVDRAALLLKPYLPCALREKVRVELISIDPDSESVQEESSFPRIYGAGLRALVVDDDEMSRELMREVMKISEIHVESRDSAQEALDLLERVDYDIIITDIHMPEVNGFQFLEHVRSLGTRHTSVYAMTADVSAKTRNEALRAGASAVFTKPLQFAEVISELKRGFGEAVS